MITGYNHNIMHQQKVYHIQTEDSGLRHPHIITHLFVGGNIISSNKTSYAPLLEKGLNEEELENEIRAMMKAQHKQMLRDLKAGSFDHIGSRKKDAGTLLDPNLFESKTETGDTSEETVLDLAPLSLENEPPPVELAPPPMVSMEPPPMDVEPPPMDVEPPSALDLGATIRSDAKPAGGIVLGGEMNFLDKTMVNRPNPPFVEPERFESPDTLDDLSSTEVEVIQPGEIEGAGRRSSRRGRRDRRQRPTFELRDSASSGRRPPGPPRPSRAAQPPRPPNAPTRPTAPPRVVGQAASSFLQESNAIPPNPVNTPPVPHAATIAHRPQNQPPRPPQVPPAKDHSS